MNSPYPAAAFVSRKPIRPSIRAQFVERRTYLRPLDEDCKVFETPTQGLDRVIGHQRWLWETQLKRPLNITETFELAELCQLMVEKKVSASGRVKWMGGTAIIKERASAAFNCLGVETAFITDQGSKTFADFKNGDEVNVWTHMGRWRSAVVKNYGQQQLNRLTLRRSARTTVSVRATENHRWILNSGKETTDLRVGDRLAAPVSDFYNWSWNNAPVDEKTWWAYGYVYGDGTVTRNGSRVESGSMVRLCGRDKEEFLPRFIELGFGYSFPPSCNADPIVYTGGYQKTLPSNNSEIRMVRAFVRGYLDADGARRNANENARRDEFHRILATSDEAQNFIRKWFPAVGLFISAVSDAPLETNYGKRSNTARWFSFYGDAGAATNGSTYKVNEIAEDTFEEVWCLEVDEDRSFTLANGVLTGNCSFTTITTPADFVDVFWLLLQGCGVGFKPVPGLMTGLPSSIKSIVVVPSTRTDKGGAEHNKCRVDWETSTWHIQVGDSAKGWAKLMGKLLGDKPRVRNLVISLEELRPGGKRLKGYGWLSSGWKPLSDAIYGICRILTSMADKILTAINIGDIANWLGTVLSSRRSAQIWLMNDTSPEIEEFIDVKVDRWAKGEGQREQSNNSIAFTSYPGVARIKELLGRILEGGDPGFVNQTAAKLRAPEMEGFNPCAEILLPPKGFCNLMQAVWHRFNGDLAGLLRAQWIAARANYRQTLVSMRDGVLQLQWEDNQKLLRLCGVSPTGYVAWEGAGNVEMTEAVRDAAIDGANSMADDLGLQRARRVTQVQPSGTGSKVLGLEGDEVHEGAHLSLSRWIFNNINFSVFDEMLPKLAAAGYHIWPNPNDKTGMLVRFPVEYPATPLFTRKTIVMDGREEIVEVNEESAISQLERYRFLMAHYVQHNCSITVSFDASEIGAMAEWFETNWDSYVGVSFLKRNDPTKSAADLGFQYLPQQCVSERVYREYAEKLLPVDLSGDTAEDMLDDLTGCSVGGACPVR